MGEITGRNGQNLLEMRKALCSILISTKNRREALYHTLNSLYAQSPAKFDCVVFDDGSSDGTSQMVRQHFPDVKLHRNETSKGYLYCRNFMLNHTTSDYAVSLDDDANFLSENPLEAIERHFGENPQCGVIAFRIFWSDNLPPSIRTPEKAMRVKGFVGCGHAWRMSAWRQVPDYPEWFVFYGEEEFAAYQLYKNKAEVHYLPGVLVHHRVNVRSRKSQPDYIQRQRRSLRSGWYLYFLFYPFRQIPRKIVYSLAMQIKNKTLKGDFKSTYAMLLAIFDVLLRLPKLIGQSNRLTQAEYEAYKKIEESKIYWIPNE